MQLKATEYEYMLNICLPIVSYDKNVSTSVAKPWFRGLNPQDVQSSKGWDIILPPLWPAVLPLSWDVFLRGDRGEMGFPVSSIFLQLSLLPCRVFENGLVLNRHEDPLIYTIRFTDSMSPDRSPQSPSCFSFFVWFMNSFIILVCLFSLIM